jgi:hypothetical protein
LLRFLVAYFLLLARNSRVAIERVYLSDGVGKEFGIKAATDLEENEILLELPGIIASDLEADERDMLSAVTRADGQLGPSGNRLLAGPVRLINHDCSNYNAEVGFLHTF